MIITLKHAIFNEADKDSFIAKRAWTKAWNELFCDRWGSAEHWTDEQMDKLLDTAWNYIPKNVNNFTSDNLLDNIREVFGEIEIIS